jgi:hypothetical protein
MANAILPIPLCVWAFILHVPFYVDGSPHRMPFLLLPLGSSCSATFSLVPLGDFMLSPSALSLLNPLLLQAMPQQKGNPKRGPL